MGVFNLLCRPLDWFHLMSASLVDLNQEGSDKKIIFYIAYTYIGL